MKTTRHTEHDSVAASWQIHDGVVRVLAVRRGSEWITISAGPDLDVCMVMFPSFRPLWTAIRDEFEMAAG
jgi:hypothetical protein